MFPDCDLINYSFGENIELLQHIGARVSRELCRDWLKGRFCQKSVVGLCIVEIHTDHVPAKNGENLCAICD